jgi:hypothetical protein
MQNYQNSDSISFSKGVAELKQMFPNFDEEIITYVLIQNNKIFEKALDTLLVMQCVDNEPLEQEISIFKNKSPIIPNKEKDNNSTLKNKNATVDNKNIGSVVSQNPTSIVRKNDKNENNYNHFNTNKNQKITDVDKKGEMKPVEYSDQTQRKKSFGQKFKGKVLWLNNNRLDKQYI